MNNSIVVLDGTKIDIDAVDNANGKKRVRFTFKSFEPDYASSIDMTAVDALTLAILLLAAVEKADPPLAPATLKELYILIETARSS